MEKDKKDTHSSDNNLDKFSNKKIKKKNNDKSSENIFESTGEQIDKLFDKQFSELPEDKANLEKQQEKKHESTGEKIGKLLDSQFPEFEEDKSNLKEEEILVLDESLALPEEAGSVSLEQEKADDLILENTQHLQGDDNGVLSKEVIAEDFESNSFGAEEKSENKESNEAVMFVDGKKVNMEEILSRDHIEPIEVDSIQEQLESIKKNGHEDIKEEKQTGEEIMDNITPVEDIPEIRPVTRISFDKPIMKKRRSGLPLLIIILAVFAVGAYFVLIKNNKHDLIEFNSKSPQKESKNIEIPSKPSQKMKRADIIKLEIKKLKTFFEKAENYIKNGDVHNARLQMILAEKITPPDNMLKRKENIQNNIKSLEKKNEIKSQKIKQSIIIDEEDFKKAESYNTIESYKRYLNKYPSGKFKFKAKSNIEKLNRGKTKEELNLIRSKTRQYQRVQLRFGYMEFAQKDIKKIEVLLYNLKNHFERKEIKNEKIIIDYSTGLMWHLWETQMDYYKAEWWTTRGYAGLFSWRIPTLEEALSISTIDFEYFSNKPLSSIQIWTVDKPSSESGSVWILDLKTKKCSSSAKSSFKYLFSCRKIQK